MGPTRLEPKDADSAYEKSGTEHNRKIERGGRGDLHINRYPVDGPCDVRKEHAPPVIDPAEAN